MFRNGVWKRYLAAVGVLFITAYLFYGRLWAVVALFPVLWWYRRELKIQEERSQLQTYMKHFGDFLQVVEVSLTTGYSLEHAVLMAAQELERTYGKTTQIVEDLQEVKRCLKLHIPIETCLEEWSNKKRIEEMKLFSQIVSTGKRRGGDMNGMIRHTADSIAKRMETEEEVRTMLAGKYFEYRVMSIMPLGILAYVRAGSPGYFDSLYNSLGGILFMTICLAMYIFAVWLGKRLVCVSV